MTDFQRLRPPGTLSSTEVCKLAGLSYRVLDYWIKTGLIDGQDALIGSGAIRSWTWTQANRVRELVWLKEELNALCERAGVGPGFGMRTR